MLQGHPAQIFHGDKPLPLVIGDLIDGADIGMVESGGGTSFAAKTFQTLLVSCQILGKNFSAANRLGAVSSAWYTTPMICWLLAKNRNYPSNAAPRAKSGHNLGHSQFVPLLSHADFEKLNCHSGAVLERTSIIVLSSCNSMALRSLLWSSSSRATKRKGWRQTEVDFRVGCRISAMLRTAP